MRRHRTVAVRVAILLGFLLLAGPRAVVAGEPAGKDDANFRLSGEVEAGIQVVQPGGNSPTFDEYRDLDRTDRGGWGHLFQVPYLRMQGEDRARTGFLGFGGTNLSRMDANYYLDAGYYNWFRFSFEYDRLPHLIAHNARTIYREGERGIFQIPGRSVAGGVVTLTNPPGQTLAAALNGVAATPTAAQRNAVQAAVDGLLVPIQLGFQTDNAKFGFSFLPLPELELSAGYTLTTRDGHVPWGSVIGSPGGNVVELAAPRNERIHEAKFGAEYARDWYQVRFNYTFSLFENEVNKIEWDNPCSSAGACSNASGFGRFSTMPENYAHNWALAGGVSLPWWNTRVTAGGAYSLWRQDETFLPYGTVPVGAGNATDAGATSPDAKIDVASFHTNLTTRPLRNVTVNARYRFFELNNKIHEHDFTNVLAGGGDTAPAVAVHTNEPMEYRKQNAGADVSWRIFRQLTAKAGYDYEHWNRLHREVERSNEHTVKGALDIRPFDWLLARTTLSHSVRTIGANGYVPLGGNATAFVAPLPQFRKFDEADRTRNKLDLYLQVTPLDTLTVSGSFYGQKDNYFNTTYGLQEAEAYGFSAEVAWAPIDRLSLFAGYAHDNYKSEEQSCAIPGAGVCNVVNTFFIEPQDRLDAVHAGFTLDVIPKRFDLSFAYRYALGHSKQKTAGFPGVAGATATNPDPGNPANVPTTENQFHVLNVVARWFLSGNWTLKLAYQYERYTEEDFTTDGIGSSLANVPLPAGSPAPAAADVRSILLGAQHPNYNAHIVGLSLNYHF